jgi:predicted O-linked N-acetylglucosamine transferase (SPINDLY family)
MKSDQELDTALQRWREGDWQAAERLVRQVLSRTPNAAGAHHLLAEIELHKGQPQRALVEITAAHSLGPSADIHATHAAVLLAIGDRSQARASVAEALRLNPGLAAAHFQLGCWHESGGDFGSAEDSFAEAARLAAGEVNAALRWAQARFYQKNYRGALEVFALAATEHPRAAAAHCGMGAAHQAIGDLAQALVAYEHALAIDPAFAQAHYNLGAVLHQLGRSEEAIGHFEAAIRSAPLLAEAHLGLARAFLALMRPDEAATAAERAIALRPTWGSALAELATALQLQGEQDRSLAALRRAVELEPSSAAIHSNLLYALNFRADIETDALASEHRVWAARHAEPLASVAVSYESDRSPERPLRVGYVSPHFREHAVSFFSEPLLAAHDREQFKVYCYSDTCEPDSTTQRFRARAFAWRDICRLSDEEVSRQIRADEIDILVDLAGHIGGNRLLTFARKPAPVQFTYLGYQNTTGMSAIDYRLTDAITDPACADELYSEKLVRLPTSFFCYQPPAQSLEVNPLPALERGYVTFASLNHVSKLTAAALMLWARIVREVPGSRLLLLGYTPGMLENKVRSIFESQGVEPDRLQVINKRPRAAYLELHYAVDLALDTFPFNGHTTICDALWMGVPSVVLQGDRYASRFGSSALVNLALDDLIAKTPEEYIAIATGLAHNLPRLAGLRRELRATFLASPLTDGPRFAREVEDAYRQAWRTWCAQ